VLGHFGILATGGSKDEGMGCFTCEVLVPDKHPFWLSTRSRPLVVCCGSTSLVLGKENHALVRDLCVRSKGYILEPEETFRLLNQKILIKRSQSPEEG
jgi:hypothetical protein